MQHAPRMQPDDIQDLSEPIFFHSPSSVQPRRKGTLLNTSLNLASCLACARPPRTENKCRDLSGFIVSFGCLNAIILPGRSVGPALLNANASRTAGASPGGAGPGTPSFPKSTLRWASARASLQLIKITCPRTVVVEEFAATAVFGRFSLGRNPTPCIFQQNGNRSNISLDA